MPKVSVIVPIYGVEKYLKEAIESILNQTLTDMEIILVDDGGKDKCPEIIDEYGAKDSRIVVIHKQNGGYGQSVNVGLERASGEYVAILEPDDYIDSKMYEDLYNIAKKYDSDVVKSSFYDNLQSSLYSRIKKIEVAEPVPEDKSFTIKEYPCFLYYHPSIWSCIYKKEFLMKHNIKMSEIPGSGWTDNLFSVQTMCLAARINYTSKAYYYWRRLNFNPSDDLKDYKLPFERSDEIHKWLNDNNISDENVLANLYKRELAYVNVVLGMKKISDKKDCYKRINNMLQRMDENIIFNSTHIKGSEKKRYKLAKKNPSLLRFMILLEQIKKNIIRVKMSSKERYISLFGKVIYEKINY